MMIAYPRSAYSAIIEICSIDNSVQLSRVFLGKFFIYGEFSEVMILRKNALEWYLHSKEKIWPILHYDLVTVRDTMYVNVTHL